MQEFILPDIGEGIVECELLEWLVEEGQSITEDEPVAEVMTDKATVQIPAMYSGVVKKLHYKIGDIAKVHAPLFAMEVAHDDLGDVSANAAMNTTPMAYKKLPQTQSNKITETISVAAQSNSDIHHASPNGRALASPAVRRFAKEQGIDIQTVSGSGKKGRVLREDIIALQHKAHSSQAQLSSTTTDITVEPLRGMKLAMAKQMKTSVQTIPHFTVSDECEMDALLALKDALKPEFAIADIKLTTLPFMVKALSLALQQHPIINSQVSADETEIHYHHQHNIGFAVDTPQGLLVPNIKDVANKSIHDIATTIQDLIQRAQQGQLQKSELEGGTITISNIGPIGGLIATPVINHPEVAIVALGKMQTLPRFDEDGAVVAKTIMPICWSGDHRIIDGATMVRFANTWIEYLQTPIKMLSQLR